MSPPDDWHFARRVRALREAKRLLSTEYYTPPLADLLRLANYICTGSRLP
jgi:hypothetical protein